MKFLLITSCLVVFSIFYPFADEQTTPTDNRCLTIEFVYDILYTDCKNPTRIYTELGIDSTFNSMQERDAFINLYSRIMIDEDVFFDSREQYLDLIDAHILGMVKRGYNFN